MNNPDWKNDDGAHFEKHAGQLLQDIYPWLLRDCLDIMHRDLRGAGILEIGCGPGFMLQQFSMCSPTLLAGLDQSRSMLQRALVAGRATDAILLQADACSLPFKEACFDTVFSRGSVFFWPDLPAACAGIKSVLKTGGQALIGGGYGLSTPDSVIAELRTRQSGHCKNDVPRLDPEKLCEIMRGFGGKASVHQANKRGFWVHWQL